MAMAPERKKKRAKLPTQLSDFQDKADLTNQQMADRLRITLRLYVSWKYGERKPGDVGRALISFLLDGKI